jgi:hypothetical protein
MATQVIDGGLHRQAASLGQGLGDIANAKAKGSLDHKSTHLEDRTKDDLMAEARKIGIEGRSKMNKDALIKAIRDHG